MGESASVEGAGGMAGGVGRCGLGGWRCVVEKGGNNTRARADAMAGAMVCVLVAG